jgi:hypothetical protein
MTARGVHKAARERRQQDLPSFFYTRGVHKAVRARHWCGSRTVPLIMIGFAFKIFCFINIILDKRPAS